MPLFRRFGRPGLLDAVAPTAVVAGTAAMTARALGRAPDGRPPAAPGSVTAQLATLSALRDADAITEAEFALAKRRVLEG